jgi:hypothetical protein
MSRQQQMKEVIAYTRVCMIAHKATCQSVLKCRSVCLWVTYEHQVLLKISADL